MSSNKFEIQILGKDNNLDGMSLKAAQALKVFVDSLTKIVELQDNSKDFRIALTPGSVKVAIEAPKEKIESIENQIMDVANLKSRNKVLVASLNSIHQTILENGLHYSVIVKKNNIENSLTDVFKREKKFGKKRAESKKPNYKLKFYSGRLFDAGGLKPNLHIEINQSVRKTIKCNEDDVKKIIKYIYSNVVVSVWDDGKKIADKDSIYELCDFYTNNDDDIYKNIYTDISKLSHDSKLESIYSKIETHRVNSEFSKINKILKLFNHKSIHPDILRMILVATKGIKDEAEISSIRKEIKEKCENQIGKIV